jgi:hypothetical protein
VENKQARYNVVAVISMQAVLFGQGEVLLIVVITAVVVFLILRQRRR